MVARAGRVDPYTARHGGLYLSDAMTSACAVTPHKMIHAERHTPIQFSDHDCPFGFTIRTGSIAFCTFFDFALPFGCCGVSLGWFRLGFIE